MTKKELIEKGLIDQYVLGLTTEEESYEVERIAILYPEIQVQINEARQLIYTKFNRDLTQPAIKTSSTIKRRVILWAGLVVSFFSIGFCFLCRDHFTLQEDFTEQHEKLVREQAKVIELASFSKKVTEQALFLQSPGTQRIKLHGCENYPEAEVMVFQCENTGKKLLRVIDLPLLPEGRHYEVWAQQPDSMSTLIGQLKPPISFDSLYTLSPVTNCASLEITSVNPRTKASTPVCVAMITD